MTRNLRGTVASILAARWATRRPGRSSPFVTQSQFRDLVRTDRADIARQLRHTEWLMHHPHRGPAAPFPLMAEWRRLLSWLDGAIQHLDQPRPVPELEHLIRTWQHRRATITAPTLRWHGRADVIAV